MSAGLNRCGRVPGTGRLESASTSGCPPGLVGAVTWPMGLVGPRLRSELIADGLGHGDRIRRWFNRRRYVAEIFSRDYHLEEIAVPDDDVVKTAAINVSALPGEKQ